MPQLTDTDMILSKADPLQFRKHGLEGKVIGALFALVFMLISAIGFGGFHAIRLGEQILESNRNMADAVKGFNSTLYSFWQSVVDERESSRKK